MIRAVIIGCAHMHVNEVALYIDGQPDTMLCGIADVAPATPENTDKRYTRAWNFQNVVNRYRVRPFDDYRAMLDAVKPDVAYLLCENCQKAEVAEEVAKRGIDVIIEKPMATTVEDAEKIVGLQKKYHVNVFVNWPVTWRKYIRVMKAAADSGKFGKLIKMRYINGHTGPLGKGAKHRGVGEKAEEMTDEERARTWWYHTDRGGGAFYDILCYGCYFSRWLFGKMPEEIEAVAGNLNTPFGDAEDNLAALFRYEDAFAVAEGTWTTPRRRMPTGPELIFSDGVIWCDGVPDGEAFVGACDVYGNDVDLSGYAKPLPEDGDFCNMPWQYAAFRLQGKKVHETLTAEFNADVIRMIVAAQKANQTHKAEKPVTK